MEVREFPFEGIVIWYTSTYTLSKKVIRIYDGDTVKLEVDLGFGVTITHKFRLHGYDSPETYRPKNEAEREAGYKVTEFLTNMIEGAGSLYIESHKLGIYGRYEGTLWEHRELFPEEGKPDLAVSINEKVTWYMVANDLTKDIVRATPNAK